MLEVVFKLLLYFCPTLLYTSVLVSTLQQNESGIHTYIYIYIYPVI